MLLSEDPTCEVFGADVVLIQRETRRVMVHREANEVRLPSMSLSRRSRAARSVQQWLKDQWNVTGILLDLHMALPYGRAIVLAEMFASGSPEALRFVVLDDALPEHWDDGTCAVVRSFLENGSPRKPGDLGWMSEALAWVQEVTGEEPGSSDAVRQWNASSAYCLVRLRMERNTYWLKATGIPNAHELAVTRFVSNLSDSSVPRMLAWREDWNAWLMKEDGEALSTIPRRGSDVLQLLGHAVEALAELQVQTSEQNEALFAVGAFDQRLARLLDHAEFLFAFLEEACAEDGSKIGRNASSFQELRSIFEAACARMERLKFPAMLVHGDLNLGNLVFVPNGCLILDWAETYVGHPLCSLQHLMLLNPIGNGRERDAMEARLIGRYRKVLATRIDSRVLDEGFATMPLIAAVAALYGRGDWLDAYEEVLARKRDYARVIAPHVMRASARFVPVMKGERLCGY